MYQKNSQPLAAFLGHVQLYVVITNALARKWGGLFTCGTQLSFKHFPSHPNWIANCGRPEKFSIASAQIERMECANISAHFNILDRLVQSRRKRAMGARS